MDVEGNAKHCPKCNTALPDGAQYCAACGSPVKAQPQVQQVAQTPAQPPVQQIVVERKRSQVSCCCWVPVVLVAVIAVISLINVFASTVSASRPSKTSSTAVEKPTTSTQPVKSPEEILQDDRKEIVRTVLRESYPSAVENYLTWKYYTNAAEVEYSVKNAFNARVQRKLRVYFEEGSAKPTGEYDDDYLYVRND